MKSSQALCHSFGHIFHFFGICFAHAASLNCLLHAPAFRFLIQCIIDAHLAAKIQLLCMLRCLREASRDVPCNPAVPLRDGRSGRLRWGWVASAWLPAACQGGSGTRVAPGASQVSQSTPPRSWTLWPHEPQVRLEREPCSCTFSGALMHFLLVIIRNTNVKNRHSLPHVP